MNSEVFRRDEIWFVAKGNAQNSKLYSLVEFKNEKGESVRKDAKFDKQYLEGKYGADPYLRRIIDWGGGSECLKKPECRKKPSRLDWKKKRRQEYLEMKQYRYYIFCEGQQTEPNYFLEV